MSNNLLSYKNIRFHSNKKKEINFKKSILKFIGWPKGHVSYRIPLQLLRLQQVNLHQQ